MKKFIFLLLIVSLTIFTSSHPVYSRNPVKISINKDSGYDTTTRMMHGMKIQNVGDDSMIIYIKKKEFNHLSKHDFPWWHKSKDFYGHWAGFEIGIGGYVNPDFNMNFQGSESYLNINTARSIMLNFNLFEFNKNLCRNHLGLTSGLGFQLNNYYFTQNYRMSGDSNQLVAYKIVDGNGNSVNPEINKLFVSWINIPVLLEYQTNHGCGSGSFHAAVGVVGGVRIGAYSKQRFGESGTYYTVDSRDTLIQVLNPSDKVIRSHGSYHLSAFKLDATLRIGWSFLNLFATYSFTPLFLNGQGPEVYPWNIGVTLMPW
jgi:hypothetical protein